VPPTPRRTDNPAPLTTAASLVAVEGMLIVLLAAAELVSLSSGRLTMGLTTAAFFAAYGAGLVWCAWAITRRVTWARGPILLAQLIQLGLAWNFWGGETTVISVVIGVVAVVVLLGMLHPASLDVLERADGE
jgi:hypothetical protein